jgi:hypothetical protein
LANPSSAMQGAIEQLICPYELTYQIVLLGDEDLNVLIYVNVLDRHGRTLSSFCVDEQSCESRMYFVGL